MIVDWNRTRTRTTVIINKRAWVVGAESNESHNHDLCRRWGNFPLLTVDCSSFGECSVRQGVVRENVIFLADALGISLTHGLGTQTFEISSSNNIKIKARGEPIYTSLWWCHVQMEAVGPQVTRIQVASDGRAMAGRCRVTTKVMRALYGIFLTVSRPMPAHLLTCARIDWKFSSDRTRKENNPT